MDVPIHTPTDLIKRVSDGDEQAFEQFFDQHWPQVYGTTLRLTKDPEKAQDLTQDVFVKIWESRERLPAIVRTDGYVFMLTRNLVLDFLRKKVFSTENIDHLIHYFQDTGLTPQERLEYQELDNLLQEAMNALPEKLGQVFHLSRQEGLTHEQIAERLGISVVTSKTYIVRALQAIRQYLKQHGDDRVLLLAVVLLDLIASN